jgi:hypothetical protein
VTIRTKEAEVPSEFPPARLYLDDIEEIVRIFRELVESPKFSEHFTPEEVELKVTFSIGNKECDDVLDLPKITRRTRINNLKIRVSKGGWVHTSLTIHWLGSIWLSSGFTKEDTWKAYHKLQPIFEERTPYWRGFIQSLPGWLFGASGLLTFFVLAPILRSLLNPHMPPTLAYELSEALSFALVIAIVMGRFPHTTVILRHASEPSTVLQGLRDKLPTALIGAALGSVLTFLLTLLGLYLKHKYWP